MNGNITEALQDALKNDEMYLVYQPIFDCNQYVMGYEVLMRWDDKEHGCIEPSIFMASFEKSTLVETLNSWFFERLIYDINEVGLLRVKKLFINLSFKQLSSSSLLANFEKLSEEINPRNIIFDVTEDTLMGDTGKMLSIMESYTKKNVSFALDDFGTGYSSMQYLKILPVRYIKIDKEFIGEIDVNHSDMAIVKAIIELSKALGLLVIAEGVENQSQFILLKSMGINFVQGYFFNHPIMKYELK